MTMLATLDALLRKGIKQYQVPGASVAVLKNHRVVAALGAGVTNLDTRVKVTSDTVFQIGSITKPHTATLIMQLVDEGKLELDAPVVNYLPDFRGADAETRQITIRQLLSHTGGIDGDYFVGSGRGDDAVERYVPMCRMVPSLFSPGERMSYCNLGYAILGRVIEVLRSKSYDQALIDHIFLPLGMDHAFSRPEESLRFNCAVGHVPSSRKKNTWYVSRIPYLAFGQKAAGSTPTMSAPDLLKFADLHLKRGKGDTGERVLSAKSVAEMQKPQVKLAKNTQMGISAWGLGWFLPRWSGKKLYGHDGATLGQFAFLRVFPEKNLAVALLTNGGDAKGLYQDIVPPLIESIGKVSEPGFPAPMVRQPDLDAYCGRFRNLQTDIVFSIKGKRLVMEDTDRDSGHPLHKKQLPLTFIDKGTAKIDSDDPVLSRGVYHFSNWENVTPKFVQTGFRQLKRTN